ncbi:MAG: hypothetical protein J0M11_10560 [Anaerolineae bacterium]|nr:hypothetical protein [Anaerolineae bacterium]
MPELNYTLQDILSALLGFLIFPCVLIAPGYVTGWLLDLFDFRQRRFVVRLGIGLVLSFAVSPIVLQLTSSLLSFSFALFTLFVFFAAFLFFVIRQRGEFPPRAFWMLGLGWTLFAIFSLINIQWGDSLFYSVTSYDQTTRVSVIDAMTRTGIPPVNPSYYPGEPMQLTFLYYFWYVLCSMVDVIGGKFVDARAALNASSAWVGLGLMALIALYFRLRNATRTEAVWKSAWLGIGLLVVSGLDVLPATLLMIRTGQIIGSIDVWNTWIQSWVASTLWVPHHLAALIAGMCAILLAQFAHGKSRSRQFTILAIAGLAFASAAGLSIYVTLVFVVFWGVWLIILILQRTERALVLPMILSGVLALVLGAPFFSGLLQGGGDAGGTLPIMFEVRAFLQLESFVADWSPLARSLIMLLVLPINYLFELGFFFIAGIYWFQTRDRKTLGSNSFYVGEIILFFAAFLIGSTLRSTLITSNDLGWRAWLPGQLILLIWGVDAWEHLNLVSTSNSLQAHEAQKNLKLMRVFLMIGILTTIADAALLRFAWPVMTGSETPRQYYSARLAYDYLRENIPADAITQNNPLNSIDRPSGLYGTHQMVISDRTAYGVSMSEFDGWTEKIAPLFTSEDIDNWQRLDRACAAYSIDVLIFADTDPVWNRLPVLKDQRAPLYENEHYALFACGEIP